MAMAQPFYLYFLAALLCFLLLKVSSTLHSSSSNTNNNGLKYLHLTFYQHDTLNKTSFVIVSGVAGVAAVTSTTSPFGSLFVNQDLLTLTPDPSSKVVGNAEGFSVTSSFNGLNNILVQKVTLQSKDHMGSLTVIGNGQSILPSDISIVGGTGDFMFVQGYVRSTLVYAKSYTLTYKADFHIYWPPYANQVSLHN
ncbi:unnamed protein product [Dovyalis caffra]|uniref:Dirigent protein n=1 Tax=Dovyalis caffra TaxID=77055 RepID=A0AAV1SR93_9ROSI|nr:unnamed protein product [Dovyalis caffra]